MYTRNTADFYLFGTEFILFQRLRKSNIQFENSFVTFKYIFRIKSMLKSTYKKQIQINFHSRLILILSLHEFPWFYTPPPSYYFNALMNKIFYSDNKSSNHCGWKSLVNAMNMFSIYAATIQSYKIMHTRKDNKINIVFNILKCQIALS